MAPKPRTPSQSSPAQNNKTLVTERWINVEEEKGTPLYDTIASHGWLQFCSLNNSKDAKAHVTMVREFYEQASKQDGYTVKLRGKTVSFSPEAINAFYGITPPHDEYEAFTLNPTRHDQLLALYFPSGTEWISRAECSVLAKSLRHDAKVWHHFVSGSMMPTSNKSEITLNRLLLIHAIISGIKIDVGILLANGIKDAAKKDEALHFPALISRLCTNAGIKTRRYEQSVECTCLVPKTIGGWPGSQESLNDDHASGSCPQRYNMLFDAPWLEEEREES